MTTLLLETTNKLFITVKFLKQDKLYIEPSGPLFVDNVISLKISGGNTDETPVITTTSANCTISGNIISGINAGQCKFSIYRKGNNILNTFHILREIFSLIKSSSVNVPH